MERKVKWLSSMKGPKTDSVGIRALEIKSGRKRLIKADTVIVAMGSRPVKRLADQLEDDEAIRLNTFKTCYTRRWPMRYS